MVGLIRGASDASEESSISYAELPADADMADRDHVSDDSVQRSTSDPQKVLAGGAARTNLAPGKSKSGRVKDSSPATSTPRNKITVVGPDYVDHVAREMLAEFESMYASSAEDEDQEIEDQDLDESLSSAITALRTDSIQPGRRRGRVAESGDQVALPPEATTTLKRWLRDHLEDPYPSRAQLQLLAANTGMASEDVRTWFFHARQNLLGPIRAAKGPDQGLSSRL